MIERGVRFVTLVHASWDHHSNINEELGYNAAMADQPIAALIKDLKQRGLLDSTLIVFAGEFGRTPLWENRGWQPVKRRWTRSSPICIQPAHGRRGNKRRAGLWRDR